MKLWASREVIEVPDPAFQLFDLCSHMKWAHLPVAGGLYDQDPEILRKFGMIFKAIDEQEAEDQRKRDAEQNRSKSRPSSAGRSRGRRR